MKSAGGQADEGIRRRARALLDARPVDGRPGRPTTRPTRSCRRRSHALNALGVEATGQIGSHDPLQATIDGLREFPADAIVLATHEGGHAHWIEEGLVDSIGGVTTRARLARRRRLTRGAPPDGQP